MQTPVPDYLQELLEDIMSDRRGHVADYIPVLAEAEPDQCAVALSTVHGSTYSVGDDDVQFSVQSISKPFVYAAALEAMGADAVDGKVGVEPSGEAFNELSLETGTHRPKNAMINAGAITVHSLFTAASGDHSERAAAVTRFLSRLAGRDLCLDEEVFHSELQTAHRNLAIAHMLRTYDVLAEDPHDVVRGYTAQCSVAVTVKDLSMMAATLANRGRQPRTGEQVVSPWVARRTLSVMAAAGMYDGAGSWLTSVGIPAKSGVSGGLIGALPGQVGAAVFSPRLDVQGNSSRGIRAFSRLSADMGMHLFESEVRTDSVIHGWSQDSDGATVRLQDELRFTGAEVLLNRLEGIPAGSAPVLFDLSNLHAVTDVGRRMLLEGMRRLRLDGHSIHLHDPQGRLPEPDMGDGTFPELVEER